jgi:hypothetical protein
VDKELTINCSIRNASHHEVQSISLQWIHDKHSIEIEHLSDNTSLVLVVPGIQYADEGVYCCQAVDSTTGLTLAHRNITVIVGGEFVFPSIDFQLFLDSEIIACLLVLFFFCSILLLCNSSFILFSFRSRYTDPPPVPLSPKLAHAYGYPPNDVVISYQYTATNYSTNYPVRVELFLSSLSMTNFCMHVNNGAFKVVQQSTRTVYSTTTTVSFEVNVDEVVRKLFPIFPACTDPGSFLDCTTLCGFVQTKNAFGTRRSHPPEYWILNSYGTFNFILFRYIFILCFTMRYKR